jgi:DNA-binding NarL/FixJ family response regulator
VFVPLWDQEQQAQVVAQKRLVLIVDDDPICRLGVRTILGLDESLEVVGEASNGCEAIDMVRSTGADLVLMDVQMPLMNGIEATQRIKGCDPNVKIIMLSSANAEAEVLGAITAGANGYCLKESNPERLVTAIKAVQEGDFWLDSAIVSVVLRNLNTQSKGPPGSLVLRPENLAQKTDKYQAISGEELELLGLLVQGHSPDQLAQMMSKSPDGLREMQTRVMNKIAVIEATKVVDPSMPEPDRGQCEEKMNCPRCNSLFVRGTVRCPYDGAGLTTVKSGSLSGTTFAEKFEILSLIGRGSGGSVYKARHKFTNRLLAIKVMHVGLMSDLNLMRRFRQEAEAASSLDHPNVLSILDFGLSSEGYPYMVMDMLDGPSVDDLLSEHGRISVDTAVRIFAQCSDGLGHAHSKGMIHRDFKPSNIKLVSSVDGRVLAKIVDFGTIKRVQCSNKADADLTVQGQVFGTPTYMSPEQCAGLPLTPATDVYSWGISLYEVLMGSAPFSAPSIPELMYMHIREAPVPPHKRSSAVSIPTALSGVIMQCLEKEPSDRFQTMGDLKDALLYACDIAGVNRSE